MTPACAYRGEHLAAFGQVERQRLFAEHVLAGLGGGHGDVVVHVAWGRDVDHVDVGPGDELAPVGLVALPAEPLGELGQLGLVASADGFHHGHGLGVEELGHFQVGV